MANYCIFVLTVTLSIVACAASFECFNCTGVTNTDSCQNKLVCGENEVCFTQRQYSGQIFYNLGCMESQKCGNFANLPSGVSRMEIDQGQSFPCFECCSRDGCNSNLCQSKDSDVCVDDKSIDCAFLNSLFNLCEDINQAKKVCPNYCKLCQVVDGHWTPWSNWSDCDVTCDNGTQIRTRSCTYPAPQYGGLDCWGNDTETKSCHREPCPIHGGWNAWSTWSECSVSCDIGMQHRDRPCTNPRPSLFGDHCFGSAEQYRICMPGACADGGWAAWGRWGMCSKSCAGGIMSRHRACSNPAPSMTGKQCLGNSEQASLCNQQACQDGDWNTWGSWGACSKSCEGGIMSRNRACSDPAPSITGKQCVGNSEQTSLCNQQACQDGGWSTWDRWGACSKSCAGGIMTRHRACSNPAPSMTGKQCLGNSEQASLCNQQACQEYNVAFTAYNVYRNSSLSTTLLFQNTYTNHGKGYSTTTGKFTCKVPGVYHFVVTLIKVYQDIETIYAFLRINGSNKLGLNFDPQNDDSNEVGRYMMTGAGTFHLDMNDVVDVRGVPNYFVPSFYSYFTGFLITPDQ